MIKKIFVIEGCPENKEEALKLTFEKLYNEKCVKDSFYEGCITREKSFPTGLDTKIPVAIPHTDSKHVIVPAVCVLKLDRPISFCMMEDDTKKVDVNFIFNMALKSNDDQLDMLNKIIATVQNVEILSNAKNQSDKEFKDKLVSEWIE
ncbi:MAG: PTS sugar transporter subunit IIA [Anaerostipes sp.]|nr:PTS sugar transporter subunit IIA [Anaerostipes sp.]